ncbi:LuxR C-terminal-related transcriptional regulator [Microvirga lotononidis]|uniref:Response regulator containing a CheY-like receiver domain and an HTH DNA-binding domain n=1 Tax=Microvirga lotononidis TaxID=864069 RepID=I4YLG4_9HYPH|nr:response regulator transcription factor [Microvirga lotononidis]EIM24806.1 response regulator containing a CheY-like receiver domain and an HTH DNA-binding domain [Microvirga lotononidis]WQO29690.1 response regulator transcription factor [Microvirga lotononidis]
MAFHSVNGACFDLYRGDRFSAVVFPVCRNHVLRLGLEGLLSETDFTVWHENIDGFACLPAVEHGLPALFMIDAGSFASGAIDLVKRLKNHAPSARIAIVADAFEPHAVLTAWDAGVQGFCLSTQGREVFIKSLELVMLGETVLPANIVLPVAGMPAHYSHHAFVDDIHHRKAAGPTLSNREVEILAYLRDGAPNKVIARKLSLSEATVKVHVKAILKKIGVCNRTQAALWATRLTLTDWTSV